MLRLSGCLLLAFLISLGLNILICTLEVALAIPHLFAHSFFPWKSNPFLCSYKLSPLPPPNTGITT